jgi:hypothetical protein
MNKIIKRINRFKFKWEQVNEHRRDYFCGNIERILLEYLKMRSSIIWYFGQVINNILSVNHLSWARDWSICACTSDSQ